MKAQLLSPESIKYPWESSDSYKGYLNLKLSDLHPTVTIVVAHVLDDIAALSNALENLKRSSFDMRLVCATSTENNFKIQNELKRLEVKCEPEIICLDFPPNVLYDFELELTHFLINFCDDTSVFLSPDANSGSQDHLSCAAATKVAASRINADIIHYQLDSTVSSLEMRRLDQRIKDMRALKKSFILENSWM